MIVMTKSKLRSTVRKTSAFKKAECRNSAAAVVVSLVSAGLIVAINLLRGNADSAVIVYAKSLVLLMDCTLLLYLKLSTVLFKVEQGVVLKVRSGDGTVFVQADGKTIQCVDPEYPFTKGIETGDRVIMFRLGFSFNNPVSNVVLREKDVFQELGMQNNVMEA